MSEAAVEVAHVSKSYHRGGTTVPVLDDINLVVEEGEFLALMGPSGSGKSTLLNLIAGIDRPDAGLLRVAGTEIATLSDAALSAWRAANIGFVFQFYNLMPVLTAFENVELPLLLTGLSGRERQEHVDLVLELVGLTPRRRHYPAELSGGEQQRVAIARAVVTDPRIIVADEPTGDLDRGSAGEVLALMQTLNGAIAKTIVMVTHDPSAASRAHRIRHLDKGVLSDGEGQEPSWR